MALVSLKSFWVIHQIIKIIKLDFCQRSRYSNCRSLTLPPAVQIQCPSLILSSIADKTADDSPSCLPPTFHPLHIVYLHKLKQTVPGNLQPTTAGEAGRLTANLHLSLISYKAKPSTSSPALWQNTYCSLVSLAVPTSRRSLRSASPNFLPIYPVRRVHDSRKHSLVTCWPSLWHR